MTRTRPGKALAKRGGEIISTQNDKRIALALILGVSLIYVAISRGVFLYGDDILMYQVTEGIVERGTFAVTSPHELGDNAQAIPGEDGRGYAKYGVGQSLVAIPAYVASKLVLDPILPLTIYHDAYGNQRLGALIYGTSLTNAVLGGATVALLWLLARAIGFSSRTALVLAGLLAFGTLLAHYAATFLSEPLTTLALTATVYGLVRATRSVSFRTHDVDDGRARLPVILGCSEGSLGLDATKRREDWHARHSIRTFLSPTPGDPSLRLRMTGVDSRSSSTLQRGTVTFAWLTFSGFAAGLALASRIAVGVTLIVPGLWLLWLAWGWGRRSWRTGLLACLAWGLSVALWLAGIGAYNAVRFGSVTETGYGNEASEFTESFLTGLTGLLVSPGKGLFWYNPPLLLALAGSWLFWRQRPDLALVIGGMLAATLALYSRYYIWDGGGVWGTRFLVPLLPLLLLPAGEVIERIWQARPGRRLALAAVVVTAALGLWVTAISIVVPYDRYQGEYNRSSDLKDAATWQIDASPIVVHTTRVDDFETGPDIAAVRYDSPRLAAISVLSAMAGMALLGWAVRTGSRRTRTPPARSDHAVRVAAKQVAGEIDNERERT